MVLRCVLYRLLRRVVRLLARGGGERDPEIVVLRYQPAILRQEGKRPQYTTADRALLAAASAGSTSTTRLFVLVRGSGLG